MPRMVHRLHQGLAQLALWVAIVAVVGSLVDFIDLDPLLGGAALLFGCLVLLIESVCRSARAGAA